LTASGSPRADHRERIVTHFSGFWDTEGVQTTILELCSFLLGHNGTTQDLRSKRADAYALENNSSKTKNDV